MGTVQEKESRLRVSRRNFLRASGAGAAVAAGAMGAVPFSSSRAFAQQGWDVETDIVVVGSGGAGFAAAITAHQLGSEVVILEKGTYIGGTTLVSGGTMWIPNNSQMREAGFVDDREDALKYMARYAFPHLYRADSETLGLPQYDFDMLSTFYDNGSVAMDLITDAGAIEFKVSDGNGPARDKVQVDYQDHLPENKAPMGRSINGLTTDGSRGGGAFLISSYTAWAEANGIDILLNHRAERVVMNDAGEVIGVEVTVTPSDAAAATPVAAQTMTFRARKGVIFASGGFSQNADMMHSLVPTPFYGGCGTPTNEGDFLRISSSVNAKLGNLANVWRNEGIYEQAVASSAAYNCSWYFSGDSFLQVNKNGHRYVDEKRNYQDRSMAHNSWDPNNAEWPNRLTFFVYDSRMQLNWPGAFPVPADPTTTPYIIMGETLEDLAVAIDERVQSLADVAAGFSLHEDFAANFIAEVAKFNEYATTGEDLDFQRGQFGYDIDVPGGPYNPDTTIEYPSADQPNVAMYPLSAEGPYYAVIMAASAVDTNGGPMINKDGQILTWANEPVTGLYGAGNCVASPGVNAYWGAGMTLGVAHVWGYAAAKHAHESAEKAV